MRYSQSLKHAIVASAGHAGDATAGSIFITAALVSGCGSGGSTFGNARAPGGTGQNRRALTRDSVHETSRSAFVTPSVVRKAFRHPHFPSRVIVAHPLFLADAPTDAPVGNSDAGGQGCPSMRDCARRPGESSIHR